MKKSYINYNSKLIAASKKYTVSNAKTCLIAKTLNTESYVSSMYNIFYINTSKVRIRFIRSSGSK